MNFVLTEQVKNTNISTNYNISAISGGAADGRHPAGSFDILEDTFLRNFLISGFAHQCTHPIMGERTQWSRAFYCYPVLFLMNGFHEELIG